jgi:3'-5' exoribonuclease
MRSIRLRINKYITCPQLRRLVETILAEQEAEFVKIQAAQNMHHAYTSGLLEHVRSMAYVAGVLVDHYSEYYSNLQPPIDKGLVIAAVILHDIGKLRELEYRPIEARYTKTGRLIGHTIIGRDLVRATAQSIPEFPEETLLLLEHAILSHHGRSEFGAPVLPMTIEALLVSYIDDLDAKMNIVARQRLRSRSEDEFTDPVYGLDNRRIYKGVPESSATADGEAAGG